MDIPFFQFLLFLFVGIALIILLTAKYRVHAFFSLMIASLVVGFGLQIPALEIIADMKEGFGSIMKSLGFIIVLGTLLGLLLGHTGSSRVIAEFILRKTGKKNAALGISITGLIIGLPVFCDSGYIVLSGINQTLSRRSGIPLITTSVSLATGLLSVHCLIPPHPGAATAAATLGVDFGKLIITGIIIAVPAMLTGYWWASFAGKKIGITNKEEITETSLPQEGPGLIQSFLPVLVPIFLIALKSFILMGKTLSGNLPHILSFLGDPIIALSIGVLLAFSNGRLLNRDKLSKILLESVEKAGSILVIIGAGGSFGAVLAAGKVGDHLSHQFSLGSLGLFFPFLLTAIIKTAQGSSTVAIITASSIILPLLPALGLDTETGRLLTVLSMGAGSMIISHANDAYFWVIVNFSGLGMNSMLKVYSLSTLLMGLISFGMVYLLSLIL